MQHIFLIGAGGFFGAISRYLISRYLGNFMASFPFGTLVVNVSGSFLLGFIMYSVAYGKSIPTDIRDLLTIGFIGAFTTMSTFSYETVRLAELNEFLFAFLNLFLNFALCIGAIYLSKELAILINK
jgi:CrcB protein